MNENLLQKNLLRASQLMNDPSFNAAVEAKARGIGKHNGGGMRMAPPIPNVSEIEAQLGLISTPNTQAHTTPTRERIINSKLPEVIKEDYLKKTENTYNTQTLQPNTFVDYSLIKTIVKEAINQEIDNLKQTLINENTVRAFKLGDGKIQFLDRKGNLYEGELKLKKKAENIKK